jgi:chemotaxis protein CheD
MMQDLDVKLVVGVADMKISGQESDVIITYALGSCLGIAVHDSVARVGGMLHVMLPSSANHAEKAKQNPYMFVDTGVPLLFRACYQLGARKENLVVKVAGGASSRDNEEEDSFQIGKNNFVMLRKLFWKNGVLIQAQDVGGRISRTMSLSVATGEVRIKSNGSEVEL